MVLNVEMRILVATYVRALWHLCTDGPLQTVRVGVSSLACISGTWEVNVLCAISVHGLHGGATRSRFMFAALRRRIPSWRFYSASLVAFPIINVFLFCAVRRDVHLPLVLAGLISRSDSSESSISEPAENGWHSCKSPIVQDCECSSCVFERTSGVWAEFLFQPKT
jgi:hypothetical protein